MSHSPATVRQFYFVMELTTLLPGLYMDLLTWNRVVPSTAENRTHKLSGQSIYRERCPHANF